MTDVFRWTSRTFHTPKAGHTQDEYEDAFAGDAAQGRFAIADGASESAFADAWARLVVNAYVQTAGPWSGWLAAARKCWCDQVQARELPWYAEAKFQEGAYAAVLGVTLKGRRWRATAVGDCCLFQVRNDRLHRAFPLGHSSEFGNRPSLLGSRRRQAGQPRTRRVHLQGVLHSKDLVILMTDALAEWFFKKAEAGGQPWKDLQAIATQEQFTQCMTNLREAKELRNDDSTALLIQPASF